MSKRMMTKKRMKEALKMPKRHPLLRNLLMNRMVELKLLMMGMPVEELDRLSREEVERDLILLEHMAEKASG